MAESVWVVGVGMTPFGVHRDIGTMDLVRHAVADALADADLALPDIQAAFYGSTAQGALEGQHMVAGQIALRRLGLQRVPVFNVENACATGGTALHLAVSHVRAGVADIALAVGVDKMNIGPRDSAMRLLDGACDVTAPVELRSTLAELGGDTDTGDAGERSVFMDIYAAMARAHMVKFGTTQRQIATVAAKNHRHAAGNPKAHYRTALTVPDILAARALAFPLTVPMCAPITDGAAAAIVCGPRAIGRFAGRRAVRVLASVVGTGVTHALPAYDAYITRLLAQQAYHEAGVGPDDVSVVEVHDATAFAEILHTEMLGLCDLGVGGRAAESGATSLAGRIPVNPSGGLESKGHPLGATGLGQVYELVAQLRGEAGGRQVTGARIALAENGGGFYAGEEAVAAITVLGV